MIVNRALDPHVDPDVDLDRGGRTRPPRPRGRNSGYDLLKYARQAIGYIWSPARSQLYTLLPRLVKDGLARGRRAVACGRRRPTRLSTGSAPRANGRSAPGSRTVDSGDRDAFHLRLFVGKLTNDDVLIRHVEAFRAGGSRSG